MRSCRRLWCVARGSAPPGDLLLRRLPFGEPRPRSAPRDGYDPEPPAVPRSAMSLDGWTAGRRDLLLAHLPREGVDCPPEVQSSKGIAPGRLVEGCRSVIRAASEGGGGWLRGSSRRHSRACRSRDGGRCNCNAGWQAWVYLPREGRKIYRSFAPRGRGQGVAGRCPGRRQPRRASPGATRHAALADGRSPSSSPACEAGAVRPKGRGAYKPATVRSYSQQLRRLHRSLGASAPRRSTEMTRRRTCRPSPMSCSPPGSRRGR